LRGKLPVTVKNFKVTATQAVYSFTAYRSTRTAGMGRAKVDAISTLAREKAGVYAFIIKGR
jgi:hypothetical protein